VGSSNGVADVLSRTPVGSTPPYWFVTQTRSHVPEGPPRLPTHSLQEVICVGTGYSLGNGASFRCGRGSDVEGQVCAWIPGRRLVQGTWKCGVFKRHDGFLLHETKIAVPHAFGLRAHPVGEGSCMAHMTASMPDANVSTKP
jgi:hypothetical protein